MASDGSGGDQSDKESRLPKDMKGLLKLCAEMSNEETVDGNVAFQQMSAEV